MAIPGKRVRIGFGVNPTAGEPTWLEWVDVTSYVRSLRIRMGRLLDLERVEAGICTLVLDNQDARFTPENTSGAYYPNVRPFAQVEVAWISDGSLTPFTLGSCQLGVSYSTLYTTAPTSNVVFRGVVERWTPEWWKPRGGICTVDCVDLFRFLQFAEISSLVCPEETTGARISRVLTHISNPFPTSIDTTGVTLAAETISGDALDYMRDIAELDGGLFYSRGDGKITYISRSTLRGSESYRTSQATLSDASGSLKYTTLRQSMDEQQIVNYVTGRTSAGTAITAQEDATSQTQYLKRIKDFGTTAITTTAELEQRALVELATKKRARLRVDDLAYEIRDSELDSATLVALDINDRVTVVRTPDQGSALSAEYLIQGWEDDVTASPDKWVRRFRVSSAPAARFILGTSTLGDTAVL